jgi:hypothetical protein
VPFHRLFKGTKHPDAWNNLTLAAGMFVSMLVAVICVQTYNERREAEAQRAIQVAEDRRREQSRVATCTLVRTMLAAYRARIAALPRVRRGERSLTRGFTSEP